jgi:3-hydroxybutyryl-CoA dehydrogenase
MLETLPEPDPAALQVAIIGGGLMGHALAATLLFAGASVSVFEADLSSRNTLADRIMRVLLDCGADENRMVRPMDRARIVDSLLDLDRGTNLAIEAIPENLVLKQRLFAELEHLLPLAILATNSSAFRVGDVARFMTDKKRAVGTHWWNPPHLMPVVEVVQGVETSPRIVEWTMQLLDNCRKTPVLVRKDTAGFIGNRLQHALWREALALVEEGVADPATVDMVARNTLGMKLRVLGPLENADYVGLDLTYSIHSYVFPSLSRAERPSVLLSEAIDENNLGAKSGAGLFSWPQGRRAEVAERLDNYVRSQVRRSDDI